MDNRKTVLRETAILAIGEAAVLGLMFGVFALLKLLDGKVLAGGIIGAVLAILNFFFLGVGAMLAADKAEQQDVEGGKRIVRISMYVRLAVLAIILIAVAFSKLVNVISLIVPLLMERIIILVSEFFRKSGDKK